MIEQLVFSAIRRRGEPGKENALCPSCLKLVELGVYPSAELLFKVALTIEMQSRSATRIPPFVGG